MGHVYDEFERTLEAWRVKYAGQPRREILRLCLIALEREELVTIAYREGVLLQRLAAMPIPQDVRTLIHHALVWAWKDEEMHAIYNSTTGVCPRPRSRAWTLAASRRSRLPQHTPIGSTS
jgi:hypothetical protein